MLLCHDRIYNRTVLVENIDLRMLVVQRNYWKFWDYFGFSSSDDDVVDDDCCQRCYYCDNSLFLVLRLVLLHSLVVKACPIAKAFVCVFACAKSLKICDFREYCELPHFNLAKYVHTVDCGIGVVIAVILQVQYGTSTVYLDLPRIYLACEGFTP